MAEIYGKIIEVMSQLNAISKGQRNTMQNFQYRGIDDVMNELHPTMAKVGVFVVPTVLNETREERQNAKGTTIFYTRLTISFKFYAQDGSFVESVVIGEAMDSGDKASNKALSIGLKYALLQVFCIPTEDDKDPDGQSHEVKGNAKQKSEPKKDAPIKLKGGDDTPEQRAKIKELISKKFADGEPVFKDTAGTYVMNMRFEKTADECIQWLELQMQKRINERAAKNFDTSLIPWGDDNGKA